MGNVIDIILKEKYLSDNKELLSSIYKNLDENKAIFLSAPTCSGKSYLQLNVIDRPIILVVPFNVIGTDFHNLYNVPFISGKRKIPLYEGKLPKKIVFNWNQLSRIKEDMIRPGTILVIDEYHQISNSADPNFRLDNLVNMSKVAEWCSNYILMSGTGNGYTFFNHTDNPITKIRVKRYNDPVKKLKLYNYEGNAKTAHDANTSIKDIKISTLIKNIINETECGNTKQMVLINNKTMIEDIITELNCKLPELLTYHLTSNNQKSRLNNFINGDIDNFIFFTTSIAESGIRIKWKPDTLHVIWDRNMKVESIQQISERPERDINGNIQPIDNIHLITNIEHLMDLEEQDEEIEFNFNAARMEVMNSWISNNARYVRSSGNDNLTEDLIKIHRQTKSIHVDTATPITENEFMFFVEYKVYESYYKWLNRYALDFSETPYFNEEFDYENSQLPKAFKKHNIIITGYEKLEPRGIDMRERSAMDIILNEMLENTPDNSFVVYNKQEKKFIRIGQIQHKDSKVVSNANYLLQHGNFNVNIVRKFIEHAVSLKTVVKYVNYHNKRIESDVYTKFYVDFFINKKKGNYPVDAWWGNFPYKTGKEITDEEIRKVCGFIENLTVNFSKRLEELQMYYGITTKRSSKKRKKVFNSKNPFMGIKNMTEELAEILINKIKEQLI